MKNKYKINDLNELKAKQLALLADANMHKVEILRDAKLHINDFSIGNVLKTKTAPGLPIRLKNPDSSSLLSGKILSIALPLILNKTLFRGSGLATRAAIGFISSKTGAKIGGHLVKYLTKLRSGR